jgi:hypothetical protein
MLSKGMILSRFRASSGPRSGKPVMHRMVETSRASVQRAEFDWLDNERPEFFKTSVGARFGECREFGRLIPRIVAA